MDSVVPIPCLSLSLIWAQQQSWYAVEVAALLFYRITYDIEFLCKLKNSKCYQSWYTVEVAALLFYHITYDIEFLCKFELSNVKILGHFLQIFLSSHI